jgi:hypothetical protein
VTRRGATRELLGTQTRQAAGSWRASGARCDVRCVPAFCHRGALRRTLRPQARAAVLSGHGTHSTHSLQCDVLPKPQGTNPMAHKHPRPPVRTSCTRHGAFAATARSHPSVANTALQEGGEGWAARCQRVPLGRGATLHGPRSQPATPATPHPKLRRKQHCLHPAIENILTAGSHRATRRPMASAAAQLPHPNFPRQTCSVAFK